MSRLNKERQSQLEPERMANAKKQIEDLGFEIIVEKQTSLTFMYNNEYVTIFPYSGWHTGKSIKDGRGLDNLLKQLK